MHAYALPVGDVLGPVAVYLGWTDASGDRHDRRLTVTDPQHARRILNAVNRTAPCRNPQAVLAAVEGRQHRG